MRDPNAHAYVNGPVVHHFDAPGWRGYRPGATEMKSVPWDTCAAVGEWPGDECRAFSLFASGDDYLRPLTSLNDQTMACPGFDGIDTRARRALHLIPARPEKSVEFD